MRILVLLATVNLVSCLLEWLSPEGWKREEHLTISNQSPTNVQKPPMQEPTTSGQSFIASVETSHDFENVGRQMEKAKDYLEDKVEGAKESIKGTTGQAKEKIQEASKDIKDKAKHVYEKVKNAGKRLQPWNHKWPNTDQGRHRDRYYYPYGHFPFMQYHWPWNSQEKEQNEKEVSKSEDESYSEGERDEKFGHFHDFNRQYGNSPFSSFSANPRTAKMDTLMYKYPTEYIVYMSIPGIPANQVNISVVEGWLEIKGQHNLCIQVDRQATSHGIHSNATQTSSKEATTDNHSQEAICMKRSISEHFRIPVDIDRDMTKASLRDGVLIVRLPRHSNWEKRIPINDD